MHAEKILAEKFGISANVLDLCREAESELAEIFARIDETAEYNQLKVINAMQESKLSDIHFAATTGYGYNDLGRDVLEEIYSRVFSCEDSLVRPQMISGTHAITAAFFGNLRPGDELLSPCGRPYDTLLGVIGLNEKSGSLKEYGITYTEVPLNEDGSFNFTLIEKSVNVRTKMATIQRSKGYSFRKAFSVAEIKELIRFIKSINPRIICFVDNCYGEFVEKLEPTNVGADLIAGSLIKNIGGGLAPVGGYLAGKRQYVENAASRLFSPALGKEAGPTLGLNAPFLQGLFFAPQIVAGALKGAVFSARVFEKLGYEVIPRANEGRSDIVQALRLKTPEAVNAFCVGVQSAAAVDSFVKPEASYMPGYKHDIIMAAGGFVQGSSIELSADAPMKPPYDVYFQGGLSFLHAKLGVMKGVQNIMD